MNFKLVAMCGIAGIFSTHPLPPQAGEELRDMAQTLRHRGPDDFGFFAEGMEGHVPASSCEGWKNSRVAFAHRRLSILDLSAAARQPMIRDNGRIFLTYNGEIYNFAELRTELKKGGAFFQTGSDTEVLLEAYRAWGMGCLSRLRGIFAFGLADLNAGKIFLVRDPLGVKPLYWTRRDSVFYFASEMKAFLNLRGFRPEADPRALRDYLRFLWIPGERTGLEGISKLEPGCVLTVDLRHGNIETEIYWSPFNKTDFPKISRGDSAGSILRSELQRAVKEELVSDVPLGAFLSGGLDSSLVVALMGNAHKTFSVGYPPKDLAYDIVPDDLPYARRVSRELNVSHEEILLSPNMAEILPKVVWHLDEPLGDPAAVSSYLICQAARQNGLTVMLSGMGGDELFAGYPRQKALVYAGYFRRLPAWLRRGITRLSEQLPGAGKTPAAKAGRALQKFLRGVEETPLSHYIGMESYLDKDHQAELVEPGGALGGTEFPLADHRKITRRLEEDFRALPLRQVLLLDLLTYLPCLNLAYTDKTSMAHGVEVRVPLLDLRLVEFSLTLSESELMRWRRGRLHGKWLLKKAAEPFLPKAVVWRKKAGFGAPVRSWLREDLGEWRRDLLGKAGLQKRDWFRPAGVEALERDFLSGRRDNALKIWQLMSLELWTQKFLDRRS